MRIFSVHMVRYYSQLDNVGFDGKPDDPQSVG